MTIESITDAGASGKTKRTRTLLAIDDDPNIGPLLGKVLEQRGYKVVSASNGNEGLEKAVELKPDFITLDIMMPEKDGWLVLKEMKQNETLREIPVAILSICDEKKLGYELGVFDYLLKPFDIEELHHMIDRLEDGSEESA